MQQSLFPPTELEYESGQSGTFVDNMRLPIHRWFRYSAGFSAQWAENVIATRLARGESVAVFDPFAGSGTTLVCAERLGVPALGVEAHPFVHRVAVAKLSHHTDPAEYKSAIQKVLSKAKGLQPRRSEAPPLLAKCYREDVLTDLLRLREALPPDPTKSAVERLLWLTFVAITRVTSHVGTAPWQYVLPNKTKRKTPAPFEAFLGMAETIYGDLRDYECRGATAGIIQGDARDCEGVPNDFASLVITSPPYANNYDYADATRLEMTLLGEVEGWGDLRESVRRHLMRSCSQHVTEKDADLEEVLSSPELEPIRPQLSSVCRELAAIRLTKGGRKTYHLMVACYFLDMAKVWRSLRRVCRAGSEVCFVLGDSAPYGVYAPVIEWNAALAQASGFGNWHFQKLRDRNTKWKNRKHRVPLQEGELWITG